MSTPTTVSVLNANDESVTSSSSLVATLQTGIRTHWLIISVVGAFIASALWVPVLTPIATTDDWGYSRSVEILLQERQLTVFPVVAATSVFQILWGSLFAAFTDNTLGAVRMSTLVMSAFGGVALYGLCGRLGVRRDISALATAAWLFNPLAFVLSYSFMTDPHFAAVLTIAAYAYVRGFGESSNLSYRWIIAGSLAASAAILIRQQGVLIPLSVGLFLLIITPNRTPRSLIRDLLAVGALPFLTLLGYIVWLNWFNGVPDVQQSFASEITEAGISGTARLIGSLTYFELMYLGFFLLPITIGVLTQIGNGFRGISRWGWLFFLAWIVVLYVGVVYFADTNRRMPYIPQFMGSGGLGPPDVRGSRPRLFEQPTFDLLTMVAAISSGIAALFIAGALTDRKRPCRRSAGLVVSLLLGQVVGVIPPSYHYLNRGYSLDRYLLPLLPLGLALLAWAVQPAIRASILGWLVVIAFAAFAMVSTRDYLVYLDAVWTYADDVHAAGVPRDRIDAGASWDGYHLYTDGVEEGITRALTRDGPWWTFFYGKATDSTYVISGRPLNGYRVISIRSYPAILQEKPTNLYLLQREGS